MDILERIVPKDLDDGIELSLPERSGFDEDLLSTLFTEILAAPELIHGAVFARNGQVFAELYSNDYGPDVPHPILSITKTITALLIGIAIENGYFIDEDRLVLDFFLGISNEIDNPLKRAIRVSHILTHTSGLEWCELGIKYDDPDNSHFSMENSDDWMKWVLSRPMANPPGDTFVYNTGAYHLLGAILQMATGLHADKFADKHLFRPLGIKQFSWSRDLNGFPCCGGSEGGLSITPRSLLKIGLMILNGGICKQNRIISNSWLDRSMSSKVMMENGWGYGYAWWSWQIRGIQCFAARGYGGQALILAPEIGFAGVFTGFDLSESKLYEKIFHRLIHGV